VSRGTLAVDAGARAEPRAAAPRLRLAMVAVGLLATLSACLGIGVRSTYGGHAAVDEPQYLLTALSIWEDRSLDISDELRQQRFLDYHDADLPVQTAILPGGRQVSPHDPVLPLLLALPVGLGGWVAAKATLAVLGGVLAALLLWTAVRRFAVPPRLAVPGVAVAACTAPLAVYGQQVYPELPAALAVTAAAALLAGPLDRVRTLAGLGVAVVVLPWLSVKYVPVAAALAVAAVVQLRHHRTRAAWLLAGLLAAGVAYLAVHRAIWGGWTVYASGDEFQAGGEFGVVGFHPNYPGRSIRLMGLLIDRDFGLGGWQPAWLLLPPAVAVLLRARPRGWLALALPLAAGWASATWVAITMNGFWWPGRQTVVVLPLAVLVILTALARLGPLWTRVAAGAAGLGLAYYAVLLVDGYRRATAWVLAPDRVDLHQPMSWLLPDDRDLSTLDYAKYTLWTVGLAAAAVTAARARSSARAGAPPPAASRTSR
jgi:hypothetical protein